VKQYGVKYTYLIAGAPAEMWEKVQQASISTPGPRRFSWDGMGGVGKVKGIHSGFASPASGEFNRQLKKEFTAKIENIVGREGGRRIVARRLRLRRSRGPG